MECFFRIARVVSSLCLLAWLSPAQGPVGEWKVVIEGGSEEATATMVITGDPDGTLVGTWTGDVGRSELADLRYRSGQLGFTRRWTSSGRTLEMNFDGNIEGLVLTGTFSSDQAYFPVRGTREATVEELIGSPYVSPLAGTWKVTSDSQLGVLERKLEIKANLSGTYESETAKWPIRDLKLEDKKVSFGVTVDVQGLELSLEFSGQLSGTTITGAYTAEGLGEVSQVTAVKVRGMQTARVLLTTELGDIVIEIQEEAAPVTSANFLFYLEAGYYNGGRFHRAVRLDNQVRDDVLIEVIQGGPNPDSGRSGYPPIILERTTKTGILHLDGTISMARSGPDTATSDFFICIGGQPSLDFGGQRNADGQGFAAFGGVVKGMDVVRKIQQSETDNRERLTPPIRIITARRIL